MAGEISVHSDRCLVCQTGIVKPLSGNTKLLHFGPQWAEMGGMRQWTYMARKKDTCVY